MVEWHTLARDSKGQVDHWIHLSTSLKEEKSGNLALGLDPLEAVRTLIIYVAGSERYTRSTSEVKNYFALTVQATLPHSRFPA